MNRNQDLGPFSFGVSRAHLAVVLLGVAPALPVSAAPVNVWLYDADPFLADQAKVLAEFAVPDWTSAPSALPGPVEATAEHWLVGSGLGDPVRTALGVAPAGARFILVNQVAPDIALASLAETPPPVQDADGNGLGDAWEQRYFGRTGVDPSADPDGDGASNGEEFLRGTDPTVPDMLRLDAEVVPPASAGMPMRLRFALPGDGQGVQVEVAGALGGNWVTVPGEVQDLGGRRVLEVAVDSTVNARFFRLRRP